MQEIGQFSTLIAHTSGSNSRSSSPTSNSNSDSTAMAPSIEIVQILLDDWNKAHQQSVNIAGALAATEMDAVGQDDSNCYDYARATCDLAEYAIKSVKYDPHNYLKYCVSLDLYSMYLFEFYLELTMMTPVARRVDSKMEKSVNITRVVRQR